jgi:hypothetical protein
LNFPHFVQLLIQVFDLVVTLQYLFLRVFLALQLA